MDIFVVTKLHEALKSDSKADTHEMTHYVDRPELISEIYDKIAYEKGNHSFDEIILYFPNDWIFFAAGSVIRMFMHALTEDTFKKGLKLYLNERYVVALSRLKTFYSDRFYFSI